MTTYFEFITDKKFNSEKEDKSEDKLVKKIKKSLLFEKRFSL